MLKRIVLSAVGAALALGVGAAGAYFTTQLQVPDSVIRAGSLAVSTEPTSAPLSVDALAPGIQAERSLTVVNDGTLPVDVVATAVKKAGITDFWDALTCRVTSGPSELYNGSLAAMRTQPLRMPPGSRADLKFAIGLPATAGNDMAEDYVKLSVYLDAEQAH